MFDPLPSYPFMKDNQTVLKALKAGPTKECPITGQLAQDCPVIGATVIIKNHISLTFLWLNCGLMVEGGGRNKCEPIIKASKNKSFFFANL